MMQRLGPAAALALSGAATSSEVMSLADYDEISAGTSLERGGLGATVPLNERLVGPRLIDSQTTSLEPELSQVKKLGGALADLSTLLSEIPNPKHRFVPREELVY